MSKKATGSIDRRDFFRKVGLGAGVAAVGLSSASAAKAAAPSGDTEKGAGYRETKHVKTFYELARF